MLEKIVSYKLKEVEASKRKQPIETLKTKISGLPPCIDFALALKRDGDIALIAEVKKASPSKGILREDFAPEEIARIYTKGGAQAISVLTDEKYFKGSLEYLKAIRRVTNLPILRKDFIIDEYQIYEARAYGADAILLIAAILTKDQLISYLNIAETIGLQALVEVHTSEELKRALDTPAKIIGINNRNLKTFNTDLDTTLTLRKEIQKENLVIVSESGINSYEDVCQLKANKIDAMLVGEALMRNSDISAALQTLLGRRTA